MVTEHADRSFVVPHRFSPGKEQYSAPRNHHRR